MALSKRKCRLWLPVLKEGYLNGSLVIKEEYLRVLSALKEECNKTFFVINLSIRTNNICKKLTIKFDNNKMLLYSKSICKINKNIRNYLKVFYMLISWRFQILAGCSNNSELRYHWETTHLPVTTGGEPPTTEKTRDLFRAKLNLISKLKILLYKQPNYLSLKQLENMADENRDMREDCDEVEIPLTNKGSKHSREETEVLENNKKSKISDEDSDEEEIMKNLDDGLDQMQPSQQAKNTNWKDKKITIQTTNPTYSFKLTDTPFSNPKQVFKEFASAKFKLNRDQTYRLKTGGYVLAFEDKEGMELAMKHVKKNKLGQMEKNAKFIYYAVLQGEDHNKWDPCKMDLIETLKRENMDVYNVKVHAVIISCFCTDYLTWNKLLNLTKAIFIPQKKELSPLYSIPTLFATNDPRISKYRVEPIPQRMTCTEIRKTFQDLDICPLGIGRMKNADRQTNTTVCIGFWPKSYEKVLRKASGQLQIDGKPVFFEKNIDDWLNQIQ